MDSYYAKVCGISSDFDMKKCSYLFRLKQTILIWKQHLIIKYSANWKKYIRGYEK